MMKQTYHAPIMDLLILSNEDVITTSLTKTASGDGTVINCGDWVC